MPQLSLHSPIGELTLSEEDGRIVALDTGWGRDQTPTPLLLRARSALQAYFDGDARAFDLPLEPHGTPFQRAAWQRLRAIPRGQTVTYGALADELGTVARALGQACARNPIPILIPCHRVRSRAGSAEHFSFADGVRTKTWLLDLERRTPGAALAGANPAAPTPFLL